MKPYYIMVHFDGSYVSGFIVPQARDKTHALKVLKDVIRAKIQIQTKRGIQMNDLQQQVDYLPTDQ